LLVKKIFCLGISLGLLGLPAKAYLGKDYRSLEPAIMRVPQEINPDLNKKVDFSFRDTSISDILLLISKVGNFNVVLPQEFDQKISITLTKQKVIDAIDDIAKLTKLNYEFKGNSLVFSEADFKSLSYVSVPLAFYSPSEMVTALNEGLFRQFEISAAPKQKRPHATIDPSKNSVIIIGTDEQVSAAKKFIDNLDQPDKVEIYTPSFLSFIDIREILRENLTRENNLKVKREDQNSVLLKGNEKEVFSALNIIKARDLPADPIDLAVEVYKLKANVNEAFESVNNTLEAGKAIRINPNIYNLDKVPNVLQYFEKIDLKLLHLKKTDQAQVYGMQVNASRDVVSKETYNIKFSDQGEFRLGDADAIFYLMDKSQIKLNKDLKIFSTNPDLDFLLLKLSVM
jgi:hypothetical protein